MANSAPTQEFVPIKEVRDGILILKDGSMRGLVMTSSLNFALKSGDEQTAIILQFQNFLNSLNFSVQIFMQSRRLDIKPYLLLLEDRYKAQPTDLMRIQTKEYIEFIRAFTESVNIMTKTFFVVVPYSPPTLDTSKGIGSMLGIGKKNKITENQTFEEHRSQLEQRVAVVEQGLSSAGIKTVSLGTEELVELFYKLFNPGEIDKPANIMGNFAK